MYKATVTRRAEQHDLDPVAVHISYIALRHDMRKQGLVLGNHKQVSLRKLIFMIEKGQPTDELTERLKPFGNVKYLLV